MNCFYKKKCEYSKPDTQRFQRFRSVCGEKGSIPISLPFVQKGRGHSRETEENVFHIRKHKKGLHKTKIIVSIVPFIAKSVKHGSLGPFFAFLFFGECLKNTPLKNPKSAPGPFCSELSPFVPFSLLSDPGRYRSREREDAISTQNSLLRSLLLLGINSFLSMFALFYGREEMSMHTMPPSPGIDCWSWTLLVHRTLCLRTESYHRLFTIAQKNILGLKLFYLPNIDFRFLNFSVQFCWSIRRNKCRLWQDFEILEFGILLI